MWHKAVKEMKRTLHLPCSIVLNNKIQEVAQLNEFVIDVCATVHINDEVTSYIGLAVEEAVVNVMSYAYPYGRKGKIDIRAYTTDGGLTFEISDTGMPFDPTAAGNPDTTLSTQERPIGGLGIYLIRKYMDHMDYKRVGDRNVLSLSKNLTNPL